MLKNMITSINSSPSKDTIPVQHHQQGQIIVATPTKQISIPQIVIKNPQIVNNSNTIASIINNNGHKRNSDNGFINSNNKTIKLITQEQHQLQPSSSSVLFKNNGIVLNDDMIINSKPIQDKLDSSSVDSDNSSHSKASIDDNNFDSTNRKSTDSNEKKKEKSVNLILNKILTKFKKVIFRRRSNTVNNEARKQQIRNSNR